MYLDSVAQVRNVSQTPLNNQSQGVRSSQKVITEISDEALKVIFSDGSSNRANSLSLTLKSLNEGIATTKVIQNALKKQENILNSANQILNKQDFSNLDENLQNNIRRDVVIALQSFNEVANSTTYQNNTLLNKDEQYLNISTSNSTFSIELPNTTKISDSLITSFRQTNLNDISSINKLSQDFSIQAKNVSNLSKELTTIEHSIKSVARSSIEEQILLHNSVAPNSLNYDEEIDNFTKNNLVSQQGYLVSSQANTNQFQSVRLLS